MPHRSRWKRAAPAILAILTIATAMPAAAHAADTDKDGLTDTFETKWGLTDPDRRDTDGDGVVDSAEDLDGDGLGNLGEQRAGTDPGRGDTDGDGTSDSQEDHDGDGRTNAQEQDQRPIPAGLKPTLAKAPKDRPYAKGEWCAPGRYRSNLVRCHFGDRSSDTTVVLMGDSHAMAWIEAAWRSAEAKHWHLITLIKSACVPLRGVYTVSMRNHDKGVACRTWRDAALDWIARKGSGIDAVVIAHSDSYSLARVNGSTVTADEKPDIWAAGLRKTLKGIPESIDVIVLADIPAMDRNPVRCLKYHPRNMSACVTPRETEAELSVEHALRAVARQEGEYPRSLSGQICPYDPCPVVQGDTLIWRDRTHINGTFARRLTPSFRQMVNGVLSGTD
jgi:SGNH domain (fused to AT3 domains)